MPLWPPEWWSRGIDATDKGTDVNEPRRHHTVPRFYLRRFAKGDKIAAIHRPTARTFKMTTKDASVRKNFYTVEGLGEERRYAVEQFLGRFEGDAAPALIRMTSPGGFPVSEQDRIAISAFLAFQIARGKKPRDTSEDALEHLGKMALAMSKPAPLVDLLRSKLGHEPTQKEINEQVGMMDPSGLGLTIPRNDHIKNMLEAVPDIVPILANRNWQMIRFVARSVITSDLCLGIFLGGAPDLTRAKHIYFPVDPRHVLLLSDSADGIVMDGKPEHAQGMNRLIASQAYEWIYHCTTHNPLDGINVKPHPPTVSSGFGGLIPQRKRR